MLNSQLRKKIEELKWYINHMETWIQVRETKNKKVLRRIIWNFKSYAAISGGIFIENII